MASSGQGASIGVASGSAGRGAPRGSLSEAGVSRGSSAAASGPASASVGAGRGGGGCKPAWTLSRSVTPGEIGISAGLFVGSGHPATAAESTIPRAAPLFQLRRPTWRETTEASPAWVATPPSHASDVRW